MDLALCTLVNILSLLPVHRRDRYVLTPTPSLVAVADAEGMAEGHAAHTWKGGVECPKVQREM